MASVRAAPAAFLGRLGPRHALGLQHAARSSASAISATRCACTCSKASPNAWPHRGQSARRTARSTARPPARPAGIGHRGGQATADVGERVARRCCRGAGRLVPRVVGKGRFVDDRQLAQLPLRLGQCLDQAQPGLGRGQAGGVGLELA